MSAGKKFLLLMGVGKDTTSHTEKWISVFGGFAGILLIIWCSRAYLGAQDASMLVASMGASAVLLFAVPRGALSQPWPLLGGHAVSALIGVACAQAVSEVLIAAPLAVAFAIGAMHYLRCIHPPGGATALTAVIGSQEIHDLGYQYVLTPVLLNAVVILLVAVAVNYAFPWRRYPAGLSPSVAVDAGVYNRLTHADFNYALTEIGSYLDANIEDLDKIYRLAVKHAWQLSYLPEGITAGLYYSNGETGEDLSVRRVNMVSDDEVSYVIVAGYGSGIEKTVSRLDFNNWQKYEVILKQGAWHRIRVMASQAEGK